MKTILLIIIMLGSLLSIGFMTSPGIVIPAESRIDFHDGGRNLRAYIYYDEDTQNLFFNSGIDLFTVGGVGFYQALYVNPREDPPMNKSVLFIVTNNDGSVLIRNVEVGPPNSAGMGYRTLRVIN